MAAPTTPAEAAERIALGPKRVQVANQSVDQQSIDEVIKADQFLRGKEAQSKRGLGMRFFKIKPGGTG
jgi:hypothetical protein